MCNMVADKTLMKLGFVKDEKNAKLNEIFKDNIKLKEIYIDIYSTNPLISSSTPFMLLLRTIEKKIFTKNNGKRLVLKKIVNYHDTNIMSILLSEINECYYKEYDIFYEFILNIHNIYYKINVFN